MGDTTQQARRLRMPRKPRHEPETASKGFTVKEFGQVVDALREAGDEVLGAAEIKKAAIEVAKAKGYDVRALTDVVALKAKVENGKMRLLDAQARINNYTLYAEAVGLMDQGDIFGGKTGDQPGPSAPLN
jgi:uncharacterized protein (UPF0335 family)